MIIYKDVITGDEMLTDCYKMTNSKCGLFYEVEGKTTIRSDTFDDSLIGANASAEEATESNDPGSVSGCDIVLNHNLQETSFNKKTYGLHLKDYVKAVKLHLEQTKPERVESFMASCKKEVKCILDNIGDFQFFTGPSMNPDGMVALLNYREDGSTPYMLFFKDGLEEEKC
ncbi:translationally-controlled tumor protein homolog [Notolabrus celidotus]|uniref:translationally-controlled tumor protein homolog n=1 Tax=Notolabrus celidotus TaxID=1203425 RepID=UPI0014905D70|nr:translationally-controlled tumor protein homolog [Notolabrus celidotus]